ncbi:ribonuclease H-like domain-containing protein [Cladochytrium replicatum]|nr:ribonuclease H-like domain-containing protein [Cladochytrium replicatum]
MKALNVFFKEFSRIYAVVLESNQTLAHEHALLQEQKLYNQSTRATYQTSAGHINQRLKKRPPATSISDVGIDGEWTPAPPSSSTSDFTGNKALLENLEKMLLSTEQMEANGYPIAPTPVPESAGSLAAQYTSMKCNRCGKAFVPTYPLDEEAKVECSFHHGYLYSNKNGGEIYRLFSCCHEPNGRQGCVRAPHVFKLEQFEELHNMSAQTVLKIPFTRLSKGTDAHPAVGIDCEMSYTMCGMELTRITVVTLDGKRIMDEVVKPSTEVVDYNTMFSGITEKMVQGSSHTLDTAKVELNKLISHNTIIIGHGLENDLKAMRILHDRVIDTSLMFPHPKGPPYKQPLRFLAQKILNRRIQEGKNGHDSYDDALAAVDVVKAKAFKRKSAVFYLSRRLFNAY